MFSYLPDAHARDNLQHREVTFALTSKYLLSEQNKVYIRICQHSTHCCNSQIKTWQRSIYYNAYHYHFWDFHCWAVSTSSDGICRCSGFVPEQQSLAECYRHYTKWNWCVSFPSPSFLQCHQVLILSHLPGLGEMWNLNCMTGYQLANRGSRASSYFLRRKKHMKENWWEHKII